MSETAPDQKHESLIYRHRAWAVLLTMLLLAAMAGWVIFPVFAHARVHNRIVDRIGSLESQRPDNITPEHWEEAVGWANTAFMNLPLYSSPTDRSGMKKFEANLKEKMAEGDSLETLKWIWDEFERSTRQGPAYAAAYRPVRAMTPDPITDETLENLWGLKTAHSLDLSDTEVGDAGMAHLHIAQNLDVLHLTNTQVTDAGLTHLEGLPKLEYLNLTGTQVTDAGVESFLRARPDCEITYGSPLSYP